MWNNNLRLSLADLGVFTSFGYNSITLPATTVVPDKIISPYSLEGYFLGIGSPVMAAVST